MSGNEPYTHYDTSSYTSKSTACLRAFAITLLIIITLSQLPVLAVEHRQGSIVAQQSTTEGPFLVNEQNRKILRVPYLHQDHVGHCWLYSIGMVATYYNITFDPDVALAFVGLGYDVGATVDQVRHVLNDLYGIGTDRRTVVRRGRNIQNITNLIVEEIDNARPIIMIVEDEDRWGVRGGHAVVITGYVRTGNTVAITINDPSGWLTYDVLGVTRRFDGSDHRIHFISDMPGIWDIFVAQHVQIDLDTLLNRPNNTIEFVLIRTNRTPNPPRVVVQAFAYRPHIQTWIYDASRDAYYMSHLSFYHNNNLTRSLWLDIPIARVHSRLRVYVFAYPNTMNQSEFKTQVSVSYFNPVSSVASYLNYELPVVLFNDFTASIGCPAGGGLECFSIGDVANFTIELYMPGVINVEIKTINAHGTVEHVWGSLDVRIYEEVVVSREFQRDGNSLRVFAGIDRDSDSERVVELYFRYRTVEESFLFIPTLRHEFRIREPTACSARLRGEAPSSRAGGYYWTCRVKVDAHSTSLRVEVDLLRWSVSRFFSGEETIDTFLIDLDLKPVESPRLDIDRVEVELSKNIARIILNYSTMATNLKEPIVLTVESNAFPSASRQISRGSSGSVVVEVDWSRNDYSITPIYAHINSSGELVYLLTKHILNPRIARVTRVEGPQSPVNPGSLVSIKYSIELQPLPIMTATGVRLDSIVTLNGELVHSTTSFVLDSYDPTKHRFVYNVTSYFRVPEISGSADSDSLVYQVMIYPAFIFDEVFVYSPELNITSTLISQRREEASEKLVYVLVLDVSGSMGDVFRDRTKLDWAKEAATLLIDMTPDGDYVGLVVFSTTPVIRYNIVQINPATREDMKRVINALTEGGWTNIGDSLKLATDMILRSGLTRSLRPVIVLLTDGIHNTGTHPVHVIDYVEENGVRVFTIGLGEPQDIDEDVLRLIAESTGGKYYYAPSPDKLREIFLAIRGAGLVVNQIDSVKATIRPNEQVSYVYVFDLYAGNHTIELSWDQGDGLDISLTIDDYLVVNESNATDVGIIFEHPTQNLVRIIIPESLLLLSRKTGWMRENTITVAINITNKGSRETLVRLDVIGGIEELLYIILDNPSGRYLRGQPIHYRVVSERNTLVIITIEDEKGTIYYNDLVFVSEHPVSLGDELGRVINVQLMPGTYYLKARLYKHGVLRKTEITPITITDSEYKPPIRITADVSVISGFGDIEVPINIQVGSGMIGKDIYIVPKLTTTIHGARRPEVNVDPWIMRLTKTDERAILKVSIPVGTTPGVYNITLVAHVSGSVQVYENLIKIVVANTTIELAGFKDVVVTRAGESKDLLVSLKIISDHFMRFNVSLRSIFPDGVVMVDNKDEISAAVSANQTLLINTKVVANRVGIHTGKLEIFVNNTFVQAVPMTVIAVSPEADTNNVIWDRSFGWLRLGPSQHIRASISVSNSSIASGFIATVVKPRSSLDYIVYVARDPGSPRPALSLFFENDTTSPVEIIVDDMAGGVYRYKLTPSGGVVNIELGDRELYRVWVEEKQQQPAPPPLTIHTVTETVTTTHTVTETVEGHFETAQSCRAVIVFLLILLVCSTALNVFMYKRIQEK